MVKDVLPSAFLKIILIMLFTLVSVVFVMSPIIHTYRHLSIGVCSNSRSFCKKVFLSFYLICYWRGVLSCGKMYLLPPRKRGVVQTQSPKYMYMYHLIYSFWLFSVRSSLHKTHLNLFFPVIMKTLVPHFLHTGGPYTTLPKYFSFFFVTCASPNSNIPDSHSTTNTYVLFVQWTHPDTRWFHFYTPLKIAVSTNP